MDALEGRIGIALGSGAARGWAHVGVLRALEERGIEPEIVCGSSAGALVGALYAAGRLDSLEKFGRELDWRQMVGYFDVTLRGGLIRARKLIDKLTAEIGDEDLSELGRPFACVATDLQTGREIWFREGRLFERVRASMAVPGLVAPVMLDGRWLVDGGVVNPVPVSLCRAMGADSVIAVDLDTSLLGKARRRIEARLPGEAESDPTVAAEAEPAVDTAPAASSTESVENGEAESEARAVLEAYEQAHPESYLLAEPTAGSGEPGEGGARAMVQALVAAVQERWARSDPQAAAEPATRRELQTPSIYEVVGNAISIMQVRLTRSRMAGDPPELLVTPLLPDFSMLDFDRAEEAMEEGRRAVARALAGISNA